MLTYFVYEMKAKGWKLSFIDYKSICRTLISRVKYIWICFFLPYFYLYKSIWNQWKYSIMNIINFNWPKINSSLSSFLCINCTKKGWRITCYLKLYYESEDFKQKCLKSMKSFTKSDLHLRALSSNHSLGTDVIWFIYQLQKSFL